MTKKTARTQALTDLIPQRTDEHNKAVTCLGLTFENAAARRAHFREALRQKLNDPDFCNIEGFPIGDHEDILNLSDPPYYTACPNPWIADFVAEWESEKPEKPADYQYHREPFAADVSEGKNDPIYNAHSYHTKVPHKAIMRYILHYTEPGDIVFDGFCGTGMTGVAAQMCGDKNAVISLGYQVREDGSIWQEEVNEVGEKYLHCFSQLGARRAVLNDLSPAATFIAYNYNTPVDVAAFEREAKRILAEVEAECGWMYATKHTHENGTQSSGVINYTVWSDVFLCPECSHEIVFWNEAVDAEAGAVRDNFPCPGCSASLTKRSMDRAWVNSFDSAIQSPIRQAKQVPVLINYSVNGKRFEKAPDEEDLALIQKIEVMDIPHWFPTDRLMEGKETRRNDPIGITHVHHFYTKRNLWVLGAFLRSAVSFTAKLIITGILQISSKQSTFRYDSRNPQNTAGGILKGTLYIPSLSREGSIFENYRRRLRSISKGLAQNSHFGAVQLIETASLKAYHTKSNTLDYIFIDPPFGANLNYSELNFLWESWLKVHTDNTPEAIENSVQGKGAAEYRHIMTQCFKEAYRLLKPGRWMTVEFSNTKAAVWNNIQTALTEAGFVVANVSALDKKQGSFKAVTTPTAVKQDLVISAYKPNGGFEERFQRIAQTEEGVWDFVSTHLKYLPIVKEQGGVLQFVPDRDPRILYDQMVAYYVRKNYFVPLSSQDFQRGLSERFPERDGMYFLSEQAVAYDRKKLRSGQIVQASLFVCDEASAIDWLRTQLKEKPRTYQNIYSDFIQETQRGWKKNEINLELHTLLEQNFLCYEGKEAVPEQIHAYLSTNWKDMRNLAKDDAALIAKAKDRWYVPDINKAGDLEKLRERALLREFAVYTEGTKKLKVFRFEAVRAGFKRAWQEKDYAVIIAVAERIPASVLEADAKLLMWYDQALTRVQQKGG